MHNQLHLFCTIEIVRALNQVEIKLNLFSIWMTKPKEILRVRNHVDKDEVTFCPPA